MSLWLGAVGPPVCQRVRGSIDVSDLGEGEMPHSVIAAGEYYSPFKVGFQCCCIALYHLGPHSTHLKDRAVTIIPKRSEIRKNRVIAIPEAHRGSFNRLDPLSK